MLRKSPASLVVLLFACSIAVSFQTSGSWELFDSPEGRFSMLTPSKPTVEVKDLDSAVGKLTLYAYSSSNNVGYYLTSFGDYPNEAADAAKVLVGVRDGVVKGLDAEITSDQIMTFEGYPGREFKAKKVLEGSEVVFNWKIILVGRRLYQIAAVTTASNAQSPDIAKYFNSFHLKK